MLGKLEDIYLNLLRLAILVVAGLVLLFAAGALVAGIVSGAKGLFTSPTPSRAEVSRIRSREAVGVGSRLRSGSHDAHPRAGRTGRLGTGDPGRREPIRSLS
jgi:hypothetical protein